MASDDSTVAKSSQLSQKSASTIAGQAPGSVPRVFSLLNPGFVCHDLKREQWAYFRLPLNDESKAQVLSIVIRPLSLHSDMDLYVNSGPQPPRVDSYRWRSIEVGEKSIELLPADLSTCGDMLTVGVRSVVDKCAFHIAISLRKAVALIPLDTVVSKVQEIASGHCAFFAGTVERGHTATLIVSNDDAMRALYVSVSTVHPYPSARLCEWTWRVNAMATGRFVFDPAMLARHTKSSDGITGPARLYVGIVPELTFAAAKLTRAGTDPDANTAVPQPTSGSPPAASSTDTLHVRFRVALESGPLDTTVDLPLSFGPAELQRRGSASFEPSPELQSRLRALDHHFATTPQTSVLHLPSVCQVLLQCFVDKAPTSFVAVGPDAVSGVKLLAMPPTCIQMRILRSITCVVLLFCAVPVV